LNGPLCLWRNQTIRQSSKHRLFCNQRKMSIYMSSSFFSPQTQIPTEQLQPFLSSETAIRSGVIDDTRSPAKDCQKEPRFLDDGFRCRVGM
jgi:hypothetical protein